MKYGVVKLPGYSKRVTSLYLGESAATQFLGRPIDEDRWPKSDDVGYSFALEMRKKYRFSQISCPRQFGTNIKE